MDFQLKASYDYRLRDDHIAYDLDVHNYNVLAEAEGIPAVLILFAMPSDPALWLDQSEQELQLRHCAYWLSLEDEQALRQRPDKDSPYSPHKPVQRRRFATHVQSVNSGLAGTTSEVSR